MASVDQTAKGLPDAGVVNEYTTPELDNLYLAGRRLLRAKEFPALDPPDPRNGGRVGK